jgi:flagellar biogenesis protein FliO
MKTSPSRTSISTPGHALPFPVLADEASLNTLRTSTGLLSRAWEWIQARQAARSSARRLRVAETVSLGEKRFVAVVQVDGRHFLLAGGPSNIALLAQLNETEPFEDVLKKTMTVAPRQTAQRKKKKTRLEKDLKRVAPPATSNPGEAFAGVLKGILTGSKTGSEKQPAKRIPKRTVSNARPESLPPVAPSKQPKTFDKVHEETVTVSAKRRAKHSTKPSNRQPGLPGDPADVSPLNTQKAALTFDQWLKRTATGADMHPVKPATKPDAPQRDLEDTSRYAPANKTPTLDNWLLETTSNPVNKPAKQTANSSVEEFA